MSSLFTPDVRYVEVVEGGFKGGNVIPAEYQPTDEMYALVKGNVNKGGHVGRYTTNDQRGAMIYSELLEVDPVSGEKLDYGAVARILEDKVRGRFMSPKKYVYKLTSDYQSIPAGTVIGERFSLPQGFLNKALDGLYKFDYKYQPNPDEPAQVVQIGIQHTSFE